MLKLTLESLEGVSEDVANEYKKGDDGMYHLDVGGAIVEKSKLDEFRTNNIAHMKEVDRLKGQLKAIGKTPEEIALMEKQIQDIADKKLMSQGKFDELLKQKETNFNNQIDTLKKANDKLIKDGQQKDSKLSVLVVEAGLQKSLSKIGSMEPGAMEDALVRGNKVYKLDENQNPTPQDEKGGILYGKKGELPLSMDEWANDLLKSAPHLFKSSTGGGALGGRGGAGTISRDDLRRRTSEGGGNAGLIEALATDTLDVQ